MKYFLIAGEASGDQHGGALISALKALDDKAEFACWGGDQMAAQAGEVRMHYRNYSVMGFLEVLLNLRQIAKYMRQCKQQIAEFKPDVLVLIDFPGFNLRMAAFAKSKGIKVVYYIAPKVWAWKESRVKKLEKYTDKLLLILPFEQQYFSKFNVDAVYVGNPTYEQVCAYLQAHPAKRQTEKPVIALLPGSRKQEVYKMAPLMCELAKHYPQYEFIMAGAASLPKELYEPYLQNNIGLVYNNSYSLLSKSYAAIVCSGTATLETALFDVPQVCGYKANSISYFIAKQLVNVKYISLVNLCMNAPVIKELIQSDWNLESLQMAFEEIVSTEGRQQMLKQYSLLKLQLAHQQTSLNAADEIYRVALA